MDMNKVVPEKNEFEVLPEADETLLQKYEDLLSYLKSLGSLAVGFSSGVDSTFLLYAAKEALGDQVIAITAYSSMFPKRERNEALEFCEKLKVRHFLVEAKELEIPGFKENPKNRCYLCKKDLFTRIMNLAKEEGIMYVAEASNLDDNGDYRPGLQAVAELKIKSPLRACLFSKKEIRILSRHFNLPTWKKQSFACLSSRFVYGETITEEKMHMVEEAEDFLLSLGFTQLRVRIHGMLGRIELSPDEFEFFMKDDVREKVYKKMKEIGFSYVTLDLEGYRVGSMNESLSKKDFKEGQHIGEKTEK